MFGDCTPNHVLVNEYAPRQGIFVRGMSSVMSSPCAWFPAPHRWSTVLSSCHDNHLGFTYSPGLLPSHLRCRSKTCMRFCVCVHVCMVCLCVCVSVCGHVCMCMLPLHPLLISTPSTPHLHPIHSSSPPHPLLISTPSLLISTPSTPHLHPIHSSSPPHPLLISTHPLPLCKEKASLASRYHCSILLEPMSLLVLSRDMYTHYLHGIAERDEDTLDPHVANLDHCGGSYYVGQTLPRTTRVSLTIRNVPKVLKVHLKLGK